jgi:tRNA A37 threonylcarbamoyladenosine synthetase subunit TsaC/SUA5/YrdC
MADEDRSTIVSNIRELKAREPFVPFNIVMASGDKYLIEYCDNLVEMKTEYFYAAPGSDSFVLLRMNQITAVERPNGRHSRDRKR